MKTGNNVKAADDGDVADVDSLFAGKQSYIGNQLSWRQTFDWLCEPMQGDALTTSIHRKIAMCTILSEHPASLLILGTRMKKNADGVKGQVKVEIDKNSLIKPEQLAYAPYHEHVPIDDTTKQPRKTFKDDNLNKLNFTLAKRVALFAAQYISEFQYKAMFVKRYGSDPVTIGKMAGKPGAVHATIISKQMDIEQKKICCEQCDKFASSQDDLVTALVVYRKGFVALYPLSSFP